MGVKYAVCFFFFFFDAEKETKIQKLFSMFSAFNFRNDDAFSSGFYVLPPHFLNKHVCFEKPKNLAEVKAVPNLYFGINWPALVSVHKKGQSKKEKGTEFSVWSLARWRFWVVRQMDSQTLHTTLYLWSQTVDVDLWWSVISTIICPWK